MFRKAVLVTLLLIGIALSVRQLTFYIAQQIDPHPAINSEEFPRLTLAEIQRLRNVDRAAGGAGRAVALGTIKNAAIFMPLSDAVFGYASLTMQSLHQEHQASDALRRALARNPRNLLARLRGAQDAAASGDHKEAVRQIEALLRLNPQGRDTYVQALAMIGQDAEGRAALLKGLSQQPPWADALARQIAVQYPETPFALQVLRLVPSAQGFYLQERVKNKAIDRAFLEWLNFLPPDRRSIQWPYDPTFKGLSAAPPFNWSLDKTSAELNDKGGLYVTTFGRKPAYAASQVLLLGQGAYRLTTKMSGETRTRGAFFRWRIFCLDTDAPPILDFDLKQLNDRVTERTDVFVVPKDGCAAQKLFFIGVPGELPLWARASVQSVAITPAPEIAGALTTPPVNEPPSSLAPSKPAPNLRQTDVKKASSTASGAIPSIVAPKKPAPSPPAVEGGGPQILTPPTPQASQAPTKEIEGADDAR